MFYLASKPLWFLAAPSNLLLVLALAGALLALSRWRRMGRRLLALGIGGFLLAGLSPLGNMLILPLEQRFPSMAANAAAPFGIIVLGGGVDERVSLARGSLDLNEAGERVTALLALARRYPQARLVFSGGSGLYFGQPALSEAELVWKHAAALGLDPGRLELETRSRNTAENARFSAARLMPRPGQIWWLVTSAYHMPRAMGAFRQAGFDVRAYPVDYRTAGWADMLRPSPSVAEGLRRVDTAAREWAGLLAYRVIGRTDALYPAP